MAALRWTVTTARAASRVVCPVPSLIRGLGESAEPQERLPLDPLHRPGWSLRLRSWGVRFDEGVAVALFGLVGVLLLATWLYHYLS
ncbi:hypothetical protein ACLQ28_30235 [Micromonospora sp. DT201]|uniref:hypothetical protein n=1 Tax=Micromonospora sp. DT201 TaxID=3393442 RepID=UPI003CF1D19A